MCSLAWINVFHDHNINACVVAKTVLYGMLYILAVLDFEYRNISFLYKTT